MDRQGHPGEAAGPGGGAQDFSSLAVKAADTPISPIRPAMTSGFSAAPPTSWTIWAVSSSTERSLT